MMPIPLVQLPTLPFSSNPKATPNPSFIGFSRNSCSEQMEMILETDPEYPGAREYLEHLSKGEQPREERPTGVGGD